MTAVMPSNCVSPIRISFNPVNPTILKILIQTKARSVGRSGEEFRVEGGRTEELQGCGVWLGLFGGDLLQRGQQGRVGLHHLAEAAHQFFLNHL